jgi:hypothetical protein
LFVIAVVVAIGAIVAGRLFSMPHASKVGVVSIVVVFLYAIAYMVLPGLILDSAERSGVGISIFVSLGNKIDLSKNDLLSYWYDDLATRSTRSWHRTRWPQGVVPSSTSGRDQARGR